MGRRRSPSLQGAARRFDTWAQAALDRQQRSLARSAVACRWRLARSAATAHQKARRPSAKSIVVFAATALGPGSDAGRQPAYNMTFAKYILSRYGYAMTSDHYRIIKLPR